MLANRGWLKKSYPSRFWTDFREYPVGTPLENLPDWESNPNLVGEITANGKVGTKSVDIYSTIETTCHCIWKRLGETYTNDVEVLVGLEIISEGSMNLYFGGTCLNNAINARSYQGCSVAHILDPLWRGHVRLSYNDGEFNSGGAAWDYRPLGELIWVACRIENATTGNWHSRRVWKDGDTVPSWSSFAPTQFDSKGGDFGFMFQGDGSFTTPQGRVHWISVGIDGASAPIPSEVL